MRRLNKFEGEDHLILDLIVVNENLTPAWASRLRVESEDGPISSRLRKVSRLRDLCLRLGRYGQAAPVPPHAPG